MDGRDLVVAGAKALKLPANDFIEEQLDSERFRACLASEAGKVPEPAQDIRIDANSTACTSSEPISQIRIDVETPVPGLIYRPDFVTPEEEKRLLAAIDEANWNTDLARRVQHYGWRYDYSRKQLDETAPVSAFPKWATELGERLVSKKLTKEMPDQLIVNEYVGNQGIARHVDRPDDFAESIATISLLETWEMVFRLGGSKKAEDKVPIALERGSVAVMTGESRYKWTHEIPKRKTEPANGTLPRRKRARRISLTFRRRRGR